MEKHDLWRNLTGTACVLGLAITPMSINSTPVVRSLSVPPVANYSVVDDQPYNSSINWVNTEVSNIYVRSISKSTGVNFFDLC